MSEKPDPKGNAQVIFLQTVLYEMALATKQLFNIDCVQSNATSIMQTHTSTLVLGASANPERYSNMAIQLLLEKGHTVYAIGSNNGIVHGISMVTQPTLWPNVATVTLYINPTLQKSYYQYLIQLQPQRIIFNPGTENPELAALAMQNGIEVVEACTLVMLRTHQYSINKA